MSTPQASQGTPRPEERARAGGRAVAWVWPILWVALAACSKGPSTGAAAPVPASSVGLTAESELLLLNGCEIRSRAGQLLQLFPGTRCAFMPGGDLVLLELAQLLRMDRHRRLLWKVPVRGHHELDVTPEGTIVVLSHVDHTYNGRPVRFDMFEHRDGDGKLLFRWDTFEHIQEIQKLHAPHPFLDAGPGRPPSSPPFVVIPSILFHSPGYRPARGSEEAKRRAHMPRLVASGPTADTRVLGPQGLPERAVDGMDPGPTPPDWLRAMLQPSDGATATDDTGGPASQRQAAVLEYYHLNSVQVLPPNAVQARIPAFKPGNFLLSFCNFSFLAIVEAGTGRLLWSYTLPGYYPGQHDARLLDNGHILMFVNNNLCSKGFCSSVVELDPLSRAITWEYRAEPPESFHSVFMGSVQRLPNGRTLVCSTPQKKAGELFEVSPDKEVVWRWTIPVGDHYRPMKARLVTAGPYLDLLEPF